jgi:Mg2+/Co2+ transporter CorC
MRAGDVMVHRNCVTFLWKTDSREEILKTIMETDFSRFPVCGEDTDDIIGILYAKKYLAALQLGDPADLKDCLLPVQFVPDSARINIIP